MSGQGAALLAAYEALPGAYDEFVSEEGATREEVAGVVRLLSKLGDRELRKRQRMAERVFFRHGVTFSLGGDDESIERIFPFDVLPRVIPAAEWERVEEGLLQRVRALDTFLADVYGPGRILAEGRIPEEIVRGSRGYLRQVVGIAPPGGVHIHVAGVDLIRDGNGTFTVLEDNLRVPSGVSYLLENRAVMKRVHPHAFGEARVRAVDDYPLRLRDALLSLAPSDGAPGLVLLTPGPFNAAFFEHAFLARRMGCELVQGADLFVERDCVYLRTTGGPVRVHAIYRRIDDAFLDPEVFLEDSMLGIPGLMRAYAAGNVTLANAPGNGVADDKAIYPFVPEMIRYYLGEDPILPQVETFLCAREDDLAYVLDNLDRLVVKAVDAAGGYGMLMGPDASRAERGRFAERIRANPRGYIAQPRVELSTCPTWVRGGLAPRRVDLRPYVVTGASPYVVPGGLTRVALRKGSYVVNSSQGGGSKDTWVLADERSRSRQGERR